MIVGGVVAVEVQKSRSMVSAANTDAATKAAQIGSGIGLLVGTFTGAALAANSNPPATGTGMSGLPKGLGAAPGLAAVPHKCTAQSAARIAQQIPTGMQDVTWRYQRSVPPGQDVGFQTRVIERDVTTPQGPKRIPVRLGPVGHVGEGYMVLTCPYTSEQFVFAKAAA